MLLPFWDQVIGIQPALAPYRDPVSVAASISRRDDVNLDVALAIWERHSRQMLTTVTGRPVLFSDYSHLTERPEAWFRQFFDFCVASGLKVTDADIDFGARIRHIERPAIEKTPTSQQSELAELICSLDGPHENFQPISLPDESPTTQRLIDSVQSPRMAARIRATFTMRPKYVVLASLL